MASLDWWLLIQRILSIRKKLWNSKRMLIAFLEEPSQFFRNYKNLRRPLHIFYELFQFFRNYKILRRTLRYFTFVFTLSDFQFDSFDSKNLFSSSEITKFSEGLCVILLSCLHLQTFSLDSIRRIFSVLQKLKNSRENDFFLGKKFTAFFILSDSVWTLFIPLIRRIFSVPKKLQNSRENPLHFWHFQTFSLTFITSLIQRILSVPKKLQNSQNSSS